MSDLAARRGTTYLLVLACALVAHLTIALFPALFEPWRLVALDQFFQMRVATEFGRPTADSRVVLVELRDDCLRRLGESYPLDRGRLAEVVRTLSAVGVRAQAWDVVLEYEGADPALDAELAAALHKAGNVTLAAYRGPDGDRHGPVPLLEEAAAGVGHVNITPDADGVIRRARAFVEAEGGRIPLLSVAAACDFHEVRPEDLELPLDTNGDLLIDWVLPWGGPADFEHISFHSLLTDVARYPDVWRESLEGRLVVVADVTTGSQDTGAVPTDASYPLPGVHAQIANSILTGRTLREATSIESIALELLLVLALAGLATIASTPVFCVGVLALTLAWVGGTFLAFTQVGVIPELVRPLMILALGAVTIGAQRFVLKERSRALLRRGFEAYFPTAVVDRLLSNPNGFVPTGQEKELCVLFSDIVGFTAATENRAPLEVQESLNEYFGEMVDVVFEHGGTVDKFIGDGLMVFFGDPEPQDDMEVRAVRAALAMQERVTTIRERWDAEGRIPIEIRVGIHTGRMVVGNMGSDRRLSYTVLGAAVNLASRLESNAPPGSILISKAVAERVQDHVYLSDHGTIDAKGFADPVATFLVRRRLLD